MKKLFSKFIFWLFGWKVVDTQKYPKKCLVIALHILQIGIFNW